MVRFSFSYILKIFNNKLKPLFINKVNRDTSKLMKTFTDVGLYSGWKLKYFQQREIS